MNNNEEEKENKSNNILLNYRVEKLEKKLEEVEKNSLKNRQQLNKWFSIFIISFLLFLLIFVISVYFLNNSIKDRYNDDTCIFKSHDILQKDIKEPFLKEKEQKPLDLDKQQDESIKLNNNKNNYAELENNNNVPNPKELIDGLKSAIDKKYFSILLPATTNKLKEIYIFVDPLCPYCQELEKSFAELNNNGIEIHLFPVSVIGGEKSSNIVISALCNKDNEDKYKSYKGAVLNEKQCNTGVTALKTNNEIFDMSNFIGVPVILDQHGNQINVKSYTASEILNNLK